MPLPEPPSLSDEVETLASESDTQIRFPLAVRPILRARQTTFGPSPVAAWVAKVASLPFVSATEVAVGPGAPRVRR